MSMPLGNICPSYDAIQLLIGWEFYVFRGVGINVCKKKPIDVSDLIMLTLVFGYV